MMPTLTSLVVPESIGAGSDAPGHAIFANALPPVQLCACPRDGPGKNAADTITSLKSCVIRLKIG
jgi:hypothetical protein